MRLLSRLLRGEREAPQETPCPRCGVPAPLDSVECSVCGWDLREAYHDPVDPHRAHLGGHHE
jgi:hypothetical protein